MTTVALEPPPSPASAPRRFVRVVKAETRSELLKFIRLPAFVVPTLAFPVMFYILFALALGAARPAGSVTVAAYMLATYGTFGVIGAALIGVGVGIASERGQGWLTVKRASPMPPAAYFIAKFAMSAAFAAMVVALLFALGATVGHVRMPLTSWALLAIVLVLGAIPFCALGCAIGFAVGPNSAPAVGNLVHLPMAILSGLWLPIEMLPPMFQRVAPALPAFHLARVALAVVEGGAFAWGHAAALVGFTLLFATLALIAYRRDEGRTYG